WSRDASSTASAPSDAVPQTSKPCAPRSDPSASRVSGWSSTMMTRAAIAPLIGRSGSADKGKVKEQNEFDAWLLSETLLGGLLGDALIAIAPFVNGRTRRREWAIANSVASAGLVLFVAWSLLRDAGNSLPPLSLPVGQTQPFYLTGTLALQALIMLVAVVG